MSKILKLVLFAAMMIMAFKLMIWISKKMLFFGMIALVLFVIFRLFGKSKAPKAP